MKRKILISVAVLFSVLLLVVIINGKKIKEFLGPMNQSRLSVEAAIGNLERNEVDLAITRLQSAVKLDPRLAEARYYMGKAYAMKGLPPELVVAEYEKAIALDPGLLAAHQELGIIYANQGKSNAAEKEFKKVIEIDPQSATAQYNLGNLYLLQEQYKGAETHLKKAVDLDPNYLDAFYNLAKLYVIQGRNKEAQAALEKSLSINPNNAAAHFYLAKIAEKRNNKPAAIHHWQKAIEQGLEGAELKEAQEHLEKLK